MKYKQLILWTAALILGGVLGSLGCARLDEFFNFVASVYTRCFQLVAAPTVALAILTALASLGKEKNMGRVFRKTFAFTLLTSFVAALVGLVLYLFIKPSNLPMEAIASGAGNEMVKSLSDKPLTVYGHILNAIPNNMLNPFLSGNVLAIVIIAAAIGVTIALTGKENENVQKVLQFFIGFQEIMFKIIRGLIIILPFGIVAFAAQLAAQISAGMVLDSIGKYLAVVVGSNVLQIFVILPLFLLVFRVNPLRVFKAMSPALLMAFFTKSSAATLPVTVATAENNLKAKPAIARFILPLCCTINMNGCAAFIFVTSMYVLQHMPGYSFSVGQMIFYCFIAVICAIGNAGVPMGCYFLTLSLMAGQNAPLGIFGVILPIYAVIDMIETTENVWSDCCICAVVDKQEKQAQQL